MNLKQLFKDIYNKNIWNDPFSRSGTGSNYEQTKVIRGILPTLFKQYKITKLLDIPCGDFFWMNEIKPELKKILVSYIGADLIDEIVAENNVSYSDSIFNFISLDILESRLPSADAILCRDCLVHFSYKDILKALINIKKSKSVYFLATTFPTRKNRNIVSGNWMPVNLQNFPFYFPPPIWIKSENCNEFNDKFSDKSLALWEIRSIKLYKFKFIMALYSVYIDIMGSIKSNSLFQ